MLHSRVLQTCLGLFWVLAGCARGEDARGVEVRHYDCEVGTGLYVKVAKDEVVVNTKSSSYRLKRRPGSPERYGSEKVAFAQDGDRAVLVGVDDGPYDGCTQIGYAGAGRNE